MPPKKSKRRSKKKSQNRSSNAHDESGLEQDFDEMALTKDQKSSPVRSDMSNRTSSSNDSGFSIDDNLKYKFRSFINDKKHRRQLWSVEFNNFLRPGEPNIFAAVGGPRFSIYQVMPNGQIKLERCYEVADAEEDFYTCCWSKNRTNTKSILLVAGVHGIIRVVEVERRNAQPYHLIGHTGAVNQLKVSPRTPFLLASASADRSIRLWNFHTKVCIATFHAVDSHRDGVVSVDFNHDCTRLVSGGLDHMIAIWDLTNPKIVETIEESKFYNETESTRAIKTVYDPFPIFSTRMLHHNYIDCVQWHSDFILSKSNENDLYCWSPGLLTSDEGLRKHSGNDAFTKIVVFQPESSNYYFVRFATTYDRSVLALGNTTGKVQLWNLDCDDPTNIPTVTLTHRKCTHNIRDVSFSRCGRDLVFSSDDGTIWLYQR